MSMQSNKRGTFKPIITLLSLILIVLSLNLYLAYFFRDSDVERMRSKYFPLIMALEIHKAKTGQYPLKFIELKKTVPSFDIKPCQDLDKRSEGCIETDDIYCRRNEGDLWEGSFVIAETFHIDLICRFILGFSTDFVCGK